MPNKWITALKQWNGEKGGPWCVPRKGSPEYDEVRAIMDGKETPARKAQREKGNVDRMAKALQQLRGIEAETKERNVQRAKEAQKGKPPKYPETEGDADDRKIAKLKNKLMVWLHKNKDGMTKIKALRYYDANFTPKLNSILSDAPEGAADDVEEDFFIEFKREIDNVVKETALEDMSLKDLRTMIANYAIDNKIRVVNLTKNPKEELIKYIRSKGIA
jgi:hypothetical protein